MALKIRGPISCQPVSSTVDILQYPSFQRHFRPFICCYIARFHCGLGLLDHDQLSLMVRYDFRLFRPASVLHHPNLLLSIRSLPTEEDFNFFFIANLSCMIPFNSALASL
ncbi:hypothetical protein T08_9970 [Trichinella sp. T8]|nr:hypothetical protein T08_9970 [Trichinella sp. T8]